MATIFIVFLLYISYVNIVTDLKIISKDGIEVNFIIDYESKCQPSEDMFLSIVGIPIVQCLLECRLRKHCGAFNFWSGISLCELFNDGDEGDTKDWNCLHVSANAIYIDTV